MHEVTVKAWVLGIAFLCGFGAHALIQDLLRYIETFKK